MCIREGSSLICGATLNKCTLREKIDLGLLVIKRVEILVEMGKCDSIEQPPDKPFFRGRKGTSTPEPTAVVGVSPGKKVNMRSQLIEQLQKWYQLLDTGAITQVQYDQLKETVMKDIKEL